MSAVKGKILVLGAGGYVGVRLICALADRGYPVRAFGRSMARLRRRMGTGGRNVEFVEAGGAADFDSVKEACKGCSAAFYLAHPMYVVQSDFPYADRQCAEHAARAAGESGLGRVVYFGDLGGEAPGQNGRLRPRDEAAEILQKGPVPVTILRAGMVIGAGSPSFEILRYLTERLPAIPAPPWVRTEIQPIAVRNLLEYLLGCLDAAGTAGGAFDLGGPRTTTCRDLMNIYAEEAALPRRRMLPLPESATRLSALWVRLITPIEPAAVRSWCDGLMKRAVCGENRIRDLIPVRLIDCREAIRSSFEATSGYNWRSTSGIVIPEDGGEEASRPLPEGPYPTDPFWSGGSVLSDRRRILLKASPSDIWPAIARIGGRTGWYYADWLFRLRGWFDSIVGGVGMRRDSPDNGNIRPGGIIDFWRIADVVPRDRMLLEGEMKLPGRAFLEFRILPADDGVCAIYQTAVFRPRGLGGIVYWYGILPFHGPIFYGMLREIGRATRMPIVAGPVKVAYFPSPTD